MSAPGHGPRATRRRVLARALTALLVVVGVAAALTVVLPPPAEEPLAVATIALLLAIPIVRVGWLGLRWWRLGDRRFALVCLALLGVVGVAALV